METLDGQVVTPLAVCSSLVAGSQHQYLVPAFCQGFCQVAGE
jgi:hypothetical protein